MTTYQPHLLFAHEKWKSYAIPGASVVDATCGNGHDALFLAQRILTPTAGCLFLIDLQEIALQKTKELLQNKVDSALLQRISFHSQCHSSFPKEIEPNSIHLLVYNLGYLPGGDKSITTQESSTLESLRQARDLIKQGGLISITCYPGHPEGEIEQHRLLHEIASWSYREWSCSHHVWLNRHKAPTVIFCEKKS